MNRTIRRKIGTLVFAAGVFWWSLWIIFPPFPLLSCAASPRFPEQAAPLLSSFTTYFDQNNAARSHNIALCARRLDGTLVPPDGEFSFNAVVGKRTKERGFLQAPVIFDGRFVAGVGGGVCQVSTTLYNAALLAGLCVSEAHAHSLQVGYVRPSLDAMVSEYCDLKIENLTTAPVAFRVSVANGSVTAKVYGRASGYEYKTESVSLAVLPPPQGKIVEGEEDALLRRSRTGLKSESYLSAYRHGRLAFRKRLRKDVYAAVGEIRQVKKTSEEGEEEKKEEKKEEPRER